jgi:hypothetical protein
MPLKFKPVLLLTLKYIHVMRFAFIAFLLEFYQFATGQSMSLALEGKEWEGVDEYLVKGRTGLLIKQTITFGDYKSLEIDRSWTKGTQVTKGLTQGIPTDDFYKKIITTDIIHKKQTLYFSLGDGTGLQSQAFCASHLDARDFNIGNNSVSVLNLLLDLAGPGIESSSIYFSRIYVGDASDGWDLFIDNQASQRHPKKYTGYLAKSETDYYSIIPTQRVKSKKGKVGTMPFGSAGYEIRNKAGEPVAAVSLIDRGVIYLMDVSPRERLLMATLCSALLLQEEVL